MMRDLLNRLAYRYQLWSTERRSDNLGAGISPPEVSPKSEAASRMAFRFLLMLICSLLILAGIARIAVRAFPAFSNGIVTIAIFLAVIWCGVGVFMMAGEILIKSKDHHEDDERI